MRRSPRKELQQSRSLVFAFACLLAVALLAHLAPARASTPPRSVVLIQVDGLSPELLDAYLDSSDAQAPDRALYRLTGAAPVPGRPPVLERAVRARAVTVLPTLPDPASATLITGVPPRVHGVRESGDPLRGSVTTLFQVLARSGWKSATAGLPFAAGSSFQAAGADDAARLRALRGWLGQQGGPPPLVMVRLDGLARALARDGTDLAPRALAVLDRELAGLLYGELGLVTPSTLVVFTAGHGATPLPRASTVGKDNLIKLFPAIAAGDIHLAGGLLWLPADQYEAAATLANLDRGVDLVLVQTAQGPQYYDREVKRLRPFSTEDQPDYPLLAQRVAGFADPGYVVVVAQRKGSYEFNHQAQVPKAGFGGPSPDESIVPVVIAGEALPPSLASRSARSAWRTWRRPSSGSSGAARRS